MKEAGAEGRRMGVSGVKAGNPVIYLVDGFDLLTHALWCFCKNDF